jgi:hypothetical protein
MSAPGSAILEQVLSCIAEGSVRVSHHGYDELAADGLYYTDILDGLPRAQIVEVYPDYPKGPCVLVLQRDPRGEPVHALWGIPKGMRCPAVLVTAYRPDAERWEADFMRRKT